MQRPFLSLIAVGLVMSANPGQAQTLFSQALPIEGIPAGGPYVPAGNLYDNEQSNGSTSLASQDSSGTLTARSADDFEIDNAVQGCASGVYDITQIRIQMVQVDTAPQAFAIDIFDDNGAGTAPTPAGAITPIATFPETSQSVFGPFGAGTSIWEAVVDTTGLSLNGDTTYWISGYGTNAAVNAAGFNNFFAASVGATGTTANGVIIAPGAGVATWTPAEVVLGPPALAFSFAIDGTCAVLDADLAISKSADNLAPAPGDSVVYTLTVVNNGPSGATGVEATDTLPAGLTYVSNDCGAAFLSPTLTWSIGALADQASVSCNVTVTVDGDALGTLVNGAAVAADNSDPAAGNNSDSVEVEVLGPGVNPLEIPTLSTVGVTLLAAALALLGFGLMGRRRRMNP